MSALSHIFYIPKPIWDISVSTLSLLSTVGSCIFTCRNNKKLKRSKQEMSKVNAEKGHLTEKVVQAKNLHKTIGKGRILAERASVLSIFVNFASGALALSKSVCEQMGQTCNLNEAVGVASKVSYYVSGGVQIFKSGVHVRAYLIARHANNQPNMEGRNVGPKVQIKEIVQAVSDLMISGCSFYSGYSGDPTYAFFATVLGMGISYVSDKMIVRYIKNNNSAQNWMFVVRNSNLKAVNAFNSDVNAANAPRASIRIELVSIAVIDNKGDVIPSKDQGEGLEPIIFNENGLFKVNENDNENDNDSLPPLENASKLVELHDSVQTQTVEV